MTRINDKNKNCRGIFETEDYFLLRVPANSLNYYNNLINYEEKDLLNLFYNDTSFSKAIFIANPNFHKILLNKKDSIFKDRESKKNKKILSSLLRYTLRSCTRATPFGSFSGVARGEFTNDYSHNIKINNKLINNLRTDMEWLLSVIRLLEKEEELLPYLRVQKNMSLHKVGSRLNIKYMSLHGQNNNELDREISVSFTDVLDKILTLTGHPILFEDLKKELKNEYHNVEDTVITNYLKQLIEQEILYTELKPPINDYNQLDYIVSILKKVCTLRIEKKLFETPEIVNNLLEIQKDIHKYNTNEELQNIESLKEITQNMEQIYTCASTIQIDSAFKTIKNELSNTIKEDIADAAECLWLLNRDYQNEELEQYRNKFMETYGVFREVSLLDVISVEKGIGYPENTDNINQKEQLQKMARNQDMSRQILLTDIVIDTIKKGQKEIKLTDELLDKISSDNYYGEIPESLEIYAEIITDKKGDSNIILNSQAGAVGIGKSAGRFAYLDEKLKEDITDSFEKFKKNNSVEYVELTYITPAGRTVNVMQGYTATNYQLKMAGIREDNKNYLDLTDLYLVATPDRFFLKSRKLDKEVRIVSTNMYNYKNAPKLCRFLVEFSMDQYSGWSPFNWGLLQFNEYLPRVVRNNVILSPQTWHFQSIKQYTNEEYKNFKLEEALSNWIESWDIPRYVYLTFSDLKLLIDLHNPIHFKELLNEIKKNERIILQEFIGEFQDRIVENENEKYIMEVVVPVVRKDVEKREVLSIGDFQSEESNRIIYPGRECLYFKLYGALEEQDTFITEKLLSFGGDLKREHYIDKWFFIRYMDPEPHLRVRFFGEINKLNESVVQKIADFASENIKEGYLKTFTINPYERELERYGGANLIEFVEDVFCADSIVSSLLLQFYQNQQNESTLDIETIAMISTVHMLTSLGLIEEDIKNSIYYESDINSFMAKYRKNKNILIKLLNIEGNWSNLRNYPRGEELITILELRSESLKKISIAIDRYNSNNELSLQQINILIDSLIHMHCNRLLGTRKMEDEVRGLIKLTLISLINIGNKKTLIK